MSVSIQAHFRLAYDGALNEGNFSFSNFLKQGSRLHFSPLSQIIIMTNHSEFELAQSQSITSSIFKYHVVHVFTLQVLWCYSDQELSVLLCV